MGEYYSPGTPVKSGSRYAYLKVSRAGLVALTVVALTLLSLSCGSPTPAGSSSSLTVSEFLTTDGIYADVADWDMSVQGELGDEYRVADWDDFLAYHNAGEDLLELILDLDNRARIDTESITSFFVTSRGGKSSGVGFLQGQFRYDYVALFKDTVPHSFLAHRRIDLEEYALVLGSRFDSSGPTLPILAVR